LPGEDNKLAHKRVFKEIPMQFQPLRFKLSVALFTLATASSLLAAAGGKFVLVGDMTVPRALHGVALLPDGKVLVAGGVNSGGDLSSAELFDPSSGMFTATGSMAETRQFCGLTNHPVTLKTGKVLITGGYNGQALATAELYDESAGTFSATGSMSAGRWCPTVTLLTDGKVLVAGGYGSNGTYQNTAELYDPSSGKFSATGDMTTGRDSAMATLLTDGKVLIVGGADPNELNSAEIYDPSSGKFKATGSLASPLEWPYLGTALLDDGKVLVTGFSRGSDAELYNPKTGKFSATGAENFNDVGNTDIALKNGDVINVGPSGNLYVAKTGEFTAGPTMVADYSSAILLKNGKVLVSGGLPYDQQAGVYTGPKH
jgi:WD40 repeat protein